MSQVTKTRTETESETSEVGSFFKPFLVLFLFESFLVISLSEPFFSKDLFELVLLQLLYLSQLLFSPFDLLFLNGFLGTVPKFACQGITNGLFILRLRSISLRCQITFDVIPIFDFLKQ